MRDWVPMATDLTWPRLMRPVAPLLYLDLNHFICLARTALGRTDVAPGYDALWEALLAATGSGRAMVPLSGSILMELSVVRDPRQRLDVAHAMERISGFNYLLGRVEIAHLEIEAGIDEATGHNPAEISLPLIRPTFAHAFGRVGGYRFLDSQGKDSRDEVRRTMGKDEFDDFNRFADLYTERAILRGPNDEEAAHLRATTEYAPESDEEMQLSRLAWEQDLSGKLDADGRWRVGRLRDLVAAREFVHEWLDIFNRIQNDRLKRGVPVIQLSDDIQARRLLAAMPHSQVAISMKTRYHRDPTHHWTVNDLADIDAMSVAYAYCDAVFTDKAARSALASSKELRAIPTYLPRKPLELAEWLNGLPNVPAGPEFVVPVSGGPLARSQP